MKKLWLMLIGLILFSCTSDKQSQMNYSQGIEFIPLSLEEAKHKAAFENKLLFLDFYSNT